MNVYMCDALASNAEITFSAGTHSEIIKMKCSDYIDLVNPVKMTDGFVKPEAKKRKAGMDGPQGQSGRIPAGLTTTHRFWGASSSEAQKVPLCLPAQSGAIAGRREFRALASSLMFLTRYRLAATMRSPSRRPSFIKREPESGGHLNRDRLLFTFIPVVAHLNPLRWKASPS